MAIAQAEIIPDAHGAVEMDGKIEFAGLVDQHAKDVILKDAVVVIGRNAAGVIFGVNGFGFFARRIAEIEAAEIGSLELHGHAAFFLIVSQSLAHEVFITGEIGGQGAQIFLLHVAMQHFFLKRDVHAHVRVLAGLIAIFERKEKRIDKENPMEALGIEIGSKRHAVGQAGFNIELIEDAVPISSGAGFFGGFLFVDQPLGVLRLEIVIGIGEERFGGGNEFGIGVAQTEDGSFVGRRGLRVHIGVVWESRVGVIVVDEDAVDLREEMVVNFLDVLRGSERFGLGVGGGNPE